MSADPLKRRVIAGFNCKSIGSVDADGLVTESGELRKIDRASADGIPPAAFSCRAACEWRRPRSRESQYRFEGHRVPGLRPVLLQPGHDPATIWST